MLVNEETGVITYLEELPRQYDMPDFIYYKGEIANTGIFGLKENRPTSGGTSLDRDRAMAKAVGEALERYSSAIYFKEDLKLSSYRDLPIPALHPGAFVYHTDEQITHRDFPLDPFDEGTCVRWVNAVHYAEGADILVPAAFVYCPYTPDTEHGEANIAESISTGIAAHCSFEEAAINAILEAVERDSFMIHWLARIACPVIRPDSLTSLHREMLRRFAAFGYEVNILHATLDAGVPTVFCTMHGQWQGSVPLIVSSATHQDPVDAITKCLEELALMERLCKRVMLSMDKGPVSGDDQQVTKLIDHLKFWLEPDIIPQADFLVSKSETVSLSELESLLTTDPPADLGNLVDRIESTGNSVYLCDLTSSDIRDLGISVVRAVIPGYVPLNVDDRCRPEGSARLRQFMNSRRNGNNLISGINPLPHPFA